MANDPHSFGTLQAAYILNSNSPQSEHFDCPGHQCGSI